MTQILTSYQFATPPHPQPPSVMGLPPVNAASYLVLVRTITNDDGQTLLEALIGPKRDQLNRCNGTQLIQPLF